MLIKNWMRKHPITISSDMLASEAIKVFSEHDLRFMPVVDKEQLRGILTRRDLREAASCVTATQNIHEMNFFNKRLRVRDLMIRKPITLNLDDTVEKALTKGKKLGRSFFPIMDGEKLVGTISDMNIYNSFYQILGVDENLSGVSVEIEEPHGPAMRRIIEEVFLAGIDIHRVFTLKDPETGRKRLLIRFASKDLKKAISVIEEGGSEILETVGIE